MYWGIGAATSRTRHVWPFILFLLQQSLKNRRVLSDARDLLDRRTNQLKRTLIARLQAAILGECDKEWFLSYIQQSRPHSLLVAGVGARVR